MLVNIKNRKSKSSVSSMFQQFYKDIINKTSGNIQKSNVEFNEPQDIKIFNVLETQNKIDLITNK